ncbi:hypothetical protein [Poriferisphaera sp. WC338]|uniref:hypothetical protein n=1 Tax=Poriferisphaera sp. WC338 TaxID=3425129 RepID=UPI003D8159E9
MAGKWLSVDQAAKALGVSASTIRRRISSNMIEWQEGERGRREVYVCFDDEAGEHVAGLSPNPQLAEAHIEDVLETEEAIELPVDREALAKQASGAGKMKARKSQNKTIEKPAAQVPVGQGEMGEYAPLPGEAVGTGHDDDGEWWEPSEENEEKRWPMKQQGFMRPGKLLSEEDDCSDTSPEAQTRRFQKLAGASVLLAQRQTDEANEKLAIVHNQLYRMRQMTYTSWAAAVLIAAVSLFSVAFMGGEKVPTASAQSTGAVGVNSPMSGWEMQQLDEEATGDFEAYSTHESSGQEKRLRHENLKLREQLVEQSRQLKAIQIQQEKARRALEAALGVEAPAASKNVEQSKANPQANKKSQATYRAGMRVDDIEQMLAMQDPDF